MLNQILTKQIILRTITLLLLALTLLLISYTPSANAKPLLQVGTCDEHWSRVPVEECMTLLDLYFSTGGAKWVFPDYISGHEWLHTQPNTAYYDVCNWKGVACVDGHIVALIADNTGLKGRLPTSIGRLSYLEEIVWPHNQLEGEISQLRNLSNLTFLDLSDNQLEGEIPEDFGRFRFRVLRLDNNLFTGEIPLSFGSLADNQYPLEYLWLECNLLTGTLPKELLNLEGVDLGFDGPVNAIDEDGFEYLDLYGGQIKPPQGIDDDTYINWLFEKNNYYFGDCPSVLALASSISGNYFFQGVSIKNQFAALFRGEVDLPNEVVFRLNENSVVQPISIFNHRQATIEYDMGTDLSYSLAGQINEIDVIADDIGMESRKIELVGFKQPSWLTSTAIVNRTSYRDYIYKWENAFPDPAFKAQVTPPNWVPLVGGNPLGIKDTQANLKLEASLLGYVEVEVGGQTGFEIDEQEIQIAILGKGKGDLTQQTFIQEAELQMNGNGTIKVEKSIVDVVPLLKRAETAVVIGSVIRWFNERAKAEATLSPSLNIVLKFTTAPTKNDPSTDIKFDNSEGTTKVGATFALVLNINKDMSTEGRGGGELSVMVQVPNKPFLKKAEGQLFFTAKIKAYRFERSYGEPIKWCFPSHQCSESRISREANGSTDIWQPIPRDYINDLANYALFNNTNNLSATESTIENTIMSNIFADSKPSLASDNATVMVWVHDAPDKLLMQGEEIYFSFYDGTAWSTPAGITDDTLQDFSPQIAIDGSNNIVAVWQRNKTQQSETSELNADYTTAFEIAYAVWDGNEWSTPAFLTNNDALDSAPKLVRGNDGQLIALWRQNNEGELLGNSSSPDRLMLSMWDGTTWSSPQMVLESAGLLGFTMARYDVNTMSIVYSQDTDDDYGTSTDQELFQLNWNGTTWETPIQLTNDNQPDNKPTLLYDSTGKPRLLWMKGDTLSALMGDLSGTPIQVLTEGSITMLDYKAIQDTDGNLSLFWQGLSDEGVDVFYATYEEEHNLFSGIIQLTHDKSLEKFMSPTIGANGELLMAYNKTELLTETVTVSPTFVITGVTKFGQTDLNFLTHTFGPDLSFEDEGLNSNGETVTWGQTAKITAILKNIGDRTVANPTVKFYQGNPSENGILIGESSSSLKIPGGITDTLTIDWSVPTTGELFTIYAVVDNDNAITELDENNNIISMTVTAVANDNGTTSNSVYLPIIVK